MLLVYLTNTASHTVTALLPAIGHALPGGWSEIYGAAVSQGGHPDSGYWISSA